MKQAVWRSLNSKTTFDEESNEIRSRIFEWIFILQNSKTLYILG